MTAYFRLFPFVHFLVLPAVDASGLETYFGCLQFAGTFSTASLPFPGVFVMAALYNFIHTQQSLKFSTEAHGYEIIWGTHLIVQYCSMLRKMPWLHFFWGGSLCQRLLLRPPQFEPWFGHLLTWANITCFCHTSWLDIFDIVRPSCAILLHFHLSQRRAAPF